VERVRLAWLEGIQSDEEPRRFEQRALPHFVGTPFGVVGGLEESGLRHGASVHQVVRTLSPP
jgi:hypothetical protein